MARQALIEKGDTERRVSLEGEVPLIKSKSRDTSNIEKTSECLLNLAEMFVGYNQEHLINSEASVTSTFKPSTARVNGIPKDQLIKLQEINLDLCDILENVASDSEKTLIIKWDTLKGLRCYAEVETIRCFR